jgi:hypothetical protein
VRCEVIFQLTFDLPLTLTPHKQVTLESSHLAYPELSLNTQVGYPELFTSLLPWTLTSQTAYFFFFFFLIPNPF